MAKNATQYLKYLDTVTPAVLRRLDTYELDRMDLEITRHIAMLPPESPKVDKLLWKWKDVLGELNRRGNA